MPLDELENYEKRVLKEAQDATADTDDEDVSLEEILEDLEDNSEFMERYREQRLQQIASDMKKIKRNVETGQYGQLTTIKDESELMRLTTSTEQVVIHFYLDSFQKCATMDSKIKIIAERHLLTRFLRISVEDCPFLVSKLQIKVLPFVVAYKHGTERDRIVGFSRLGNQPDDFDIQVLEAILFQCGVLARKSNHRFLGSGRTEESDSDLDI